MNRVWKLAALVALCAALPAELRAREIGEPLTLERVIALSSQSAPALRLAANSVEEQEAKLDGARVRSLENPKLSLAAGPRSGDGTTLDLEAEIEVPVELGGRREKRVAVAQAGLKRERQFAEATRREAVAAAVIAYYGVLQAEERLALALDRKTLAAEFATVARERNAAGDAPRFEVNLASAELARAESETASTQAKAVAARTKLARALGLSSPAGLTVAGELKDRTLFDRIAAAPAPAVRADLLAAQADLEAARAEVSLAQSETRPDLALRLGVKREGDENVAVAGVSVTLPFFNPRTAQVREARVRQQRAQLSAELASAAVAVEVEGTRQAYAAAVESVLRMEKDGIPLQKENETLARESYRAGKINLPTLLQLRREALETRQEYLELLLDAAEAGVELATAAGAWTGTD